MWVDSNRPKRLRAFVAHAPNYCQGPPRRRSIAFTGDVALYGNDLPKRFRRGARLPLKANPLQVVAPLLRAADLAVANVEGGIDALVLERAHNDLGTGHHICHLVRHGLSPFGPLSSGNKKGPGGASHARKLRKRYAPGPLRAILTIS